MRSPRHLRAIFLGLFCFAAAAGAQPLLNGQNSIQSASGEFTVTAITGYSPLSHLPAIVTNSFFVRLEPTLLAVSAGRFKDALCHELDLPANAPLGGKIYLVVRPAHSLDDEIILTAQPFLREWNCRVELPDVLTQPRFARSLAAALLLTFANRDAAVTHHSAEIPAWLADGFGRQILSENFAQIILSAPGQNLEGVLQTRRGETQRGLDPLRETRLALQNSPALTFAQLSWPDAAQLSGDDGGAYQASAQLFVSDLLALKNGPAKMRAMLQKFSTTENWQTAFFAAFSENFRRPLDVEKWWALRVVNFEARAPGPRWTAATSRDRMIELLSVPVELRASSNALPAHAEISLQETIRNFPAPERTALLQTKLRDLELARLRMATPFAQLIDGYCAALGDFLGEKKNNPSANSKYPVPMRRLASAVDTLKKLDALDARRREVEARLRTAVLPENESREPR